MRSLKLLSVTLCLLFFIPFSSKAQITAEDMGNWHTRMTEIAVARLQEYIALDQDTAISNQNFYDGILFDSLKSVTGYSLLTIDSVFLSLGLTKSTMNVWSSLDFNFTGRQGILFASLDSLVELNYAPDDFETAIWGIRSNFNDFDTLGMDGIFEIAISSYNYWYSNLDELNVDNTPIDISAQDIIGADIKGAIAGFLGGLVSGPGVVASTVLGAVGGTLVEAAVEVGKKIMER